MADSSLVVTYGGRPSNKRQRWFRGSDAREALLIGLSALTVKTLPVDRWASISDQMFRLERGLGSRRFRRFHNRVTAFFGPEADNKIVEGLWRGFRTGQHRRRMLVIAERLLADFRPTISLEGREHLDRALAAGNGAIVWSDNLRYHPVVGQRATADAGYRSWQISSSDHGFSSSLVGRKFLNPIQVAAEERYLERRIVFNDESALMATREVRQHLARNGIVRITNNAYIGRRFVYAPIGHAAWLRVATTPLNLALKSGAALLPVAVVENVPFRDYSVTIAPPIPVVATDGSGKVEIFRTAARRYMAYLEPIVRAHPEQWIMWMGPIDQGPTNHEGEEVE